MSKCDWDLFGWYNTVSSRRAREALGRDEFRRVDGVLWREAGNEDHARREAYYDNGVQVRYYGGKGTYWKRS